MLAADKLLLQSSLKQNAIQLKEKEFNLHNANFSNIGTMASVLAGFAMTAFIEFQPNPGTNRHLKFIYYCLVIISLGANMFCVVTTAALSILGTGLALRGPDGSMVTAVEGMYAERARCFLSFGVGVLALQGSAMFGAWIIMEVETAACCTILLLMLGFSTFRAVRRIQIRLAFDESEAVDFNDVFSAVQHMTKGGRKARRKRVGEDKDDASDNGLLESMENGMAYNRAYGSP